MHHTDFAISRPASKPSPVASPSWTDERTALLLKLNGEGCSASEMAGQIGGVSRSAIIGKLRRMGVEMRTSTLRERVNRLVANSEDSKKQRKPRQPKPKTQAARLAQSHASFVEACEATDLPEDQSDCAVTFFVAGDNQCRWPLGDPADLGTFRFCGSKRPGDGPYCARHSKLAYQPSRSLPISNEERERRRQRAMTNFTRRNAAA